MTVMQMHGSEVVIHDDLSFTAQVDQEWISLLVKLALEGVFASSPDRAFDLANAIIRQNPEAGFTILHNDPPQHQFDPDVLY